MKVLVLPQERSNPYQEQLYGAMRRHGVEVIYVGELTPSHTLNLLLLPLELAARRIGGARLLHLHWVFCFSLPGAELFPAMRMLAQTWFNVCLTVTRILGLRLVWTAHNVLPHSPVFRDDIQARRRLVLTCHLVLAHSQSALTALSEIGAAPRKSTVISHGPLSPPVAFGSLRPPGTGSGPRRFLFFGKIMDYKGVEDLLVAFKDLPVGLRVHLLVAGECQETHLRSTLRALAVHSADRVTLRLERIPEPEVTPLFAEADVVVLPFRQITTSGSAVLALCHGRPLIMPDLPALADLSGPAVWWYDGTIPGLTAVLAKVAHLDGAELAAKSEAARVQASETSWDEIAECTLKQMAHLWAPSRVRAVRSKAAGTPTDPSSYSRNRSS